MSHEVFISFSNKDSQIAKALCHMLEENKIRCWIASRDIRLGEVWADEIAAAIPKSKVLIILLSKNSNSSKQVLREIEIAIHSDIVVLPVRIEDIMPTGGMSYYLSTTHWIDVIDEEIENKISAISDRIKNILNNTKEDDIPPKETDKPKELISSETKKNKTINVKRLIIVLSSAVVFVAAGLTLLLLREAIFNLGNEPDLVKEATITDVSPTQNTQQTQTLDYNPTPTPSVTAVATNTPKPEAPLWTPEDFGYDPDMVVPIASDVLKEAIVLTLENSGKPAAGELTVADMFNLRELFIVSPDDKFELYIAIETGFLKNYDCVFETEKIIGDNLQGIEYAKNINVLFIINKKILDFNPLSELTSLEILSLGGDHGQIKPDNIDSFSELEYLRFLRIGDNYISDISALSNLENLSFLDLPSNMLTDISAIANLSNIEFLGINESKGLSDLSYLQGSALIKNVEDLVVSGNGLEDISFLSNAYNLRHLNIRDNNISDISVLSNLNLKDLYLDIGTYNNNIETINKLTAKGCNVSPE